MAFCSNCGHQLDDKAKFCSACGASRLVQQTENENKRKTVYEGEIHKCPNCGEVIEAFTAKCPSCGFEIRDSRASDSIQEFAARIENAGSIPQKVDIIRSFPVPNDRENIFEFLILAATNLNVEIAEADTSESKKVFNAWLSKMEQSYQKARLLFNGDSDFARIQKIYDDTHKKIGMKRKALSASKVFSVLLRTCVMWCGLILFLIAFYLDVSDSGANTSIFHLGGMIVLIVGAFIVGKGNAGLPDVGVGVLCGVVSLIMGTTLQERFAENGSAMELGGGAALVIVAIMFVRSLVKKKDS